MLVRPIFFFCHQGEIREQCFAVDYTEFITEAKYLLDNTDLSIKEIATKLNFPTQSFFGKYFKQYVGISPKEYRNKLIKQ